MNESMRDLYSGVEETACKKKYEEVLDEMQQFFSRNNAELFNTENRSDGEYEKLQKRYIEKYLSDEHISLPDFSDKKSLIEKIHNDMAGFGVLDDLIYEPGTKIPQKDLEEVNINSWEDIEVIKTNQPLKKAHIHFNNAQEAKNILNRILTINGTKIDVMNPSLVTYLPHGIRVCVNQYPIVTREDGIAASIRIVTPGRLTTEDIIQDNIASVGMLNLITTLHSYGVSMAISGGTSSGKSTFLCAILKAIEDGKRIVIIEEGTKEILILRRDKDEFIQNSVVSMTTRPHHDAQYNITASKLIERALTMNPDYIIIAEMKGEESIIAAEAAITGQVCMTTIHADEANLVYERMADLALKKYQMPKQHLIEKMVRSFPVIVQLAGKQNRKVLEIVEATGTEGVKPVINVLYRFNFETGKHEKINNISPKLQEFLLKKGLPKDALNEILKGV